MKPGILTLIVFIPAIVAFSLMFFPADKDNLIKSVSLIGTVIPLALSCLLLSSFNSLTGDYQFVERADWIEAFNIEYYIGVDGISIMLVVLSSLLFVVAMIASWNIEKMIKGYCIMFLLLATGVMGTFVALDLFLFFIFWELTLLPMYFLIGIWGGPRKEYAAIKFFLYTMFGSVLMLLGIIAVYWQADPHTFAMPALIEANLDGVVQLPWITLSWVPFYLAEVSFTHVVFLLFAIGFAVKIPVFPFHTWLPDAHVEAPTPISVILAGILLKMGSYGFYRVAFPFFPEASTYFAWLIALLGLINIVYGSLCAMAQQDLKKLVAYSSIGHMGYMLLGMASFVQIGLMGGHFQMFTHGLSSGLLFLLVGVVYDRAHHRNIDGFGGLASQMPRYGFVMGLATFAGLGLPGFAPFISESFSFLGAFKSTLAGTLYLPWFTGIVSIPMTVSTLAVLSLSGIVLTAGYMLWMYQRVFFEEPNPENADFPDINAREMTAAAPLCALLLFFGIYPSAYYNIIEASIVNLKEIIG